MANGAVQDFDPNKKIVTVRWLASRDGERAYKDAQQSGVLPILFVKQRRRKPEDKLRATDPW